MEFSLGLVAAGEIAFLSRLEMRSTACFVGVGAISNRLGVPIRTRGLIRHGGRRASLIVCPVASGPFNHGRGLRVSPFGRTRGFGVNSFTRCGIGASSFGRHGDLRVNQGLACYQVPARGWIDPCCLGRNHVPSSTIHASTRVKYLQIHCL